MTNSAIAIAVAASLVLALASWWLVRRAMRSYRNRVRRRWQDLNRARCLRCGYDLTSLNVPRCPECGALRGFTRSAAELGIDERDLRR